MNQITPTQQIKRSVIIPRELFYSGLDAKLFVENIRQIACIIDWEWDNDDKMLMHLYFQEEPLKEQDVYDITYLCRRFDIDVNYFGQFISEENRKYIKLHPFTRVFEEEPNLVCEDPEHTPYRLTCKEVVFYSKVDADFFFKCFEVIEWTVHPWGDSENIYFHLKSNIIPPEDFFEILMIFKRYEIDTEQLITYITDEIVEFFTKNEMIELLTALYDKTHNAAA